MLERIQRETHENRTMSDAEIVDIVKTLNGGRVVSCGTRS